MWKGKKGKKSLISVFLVDAIFLVGILGCVAFSKNEGGKNSQLLGSLVLRKFDNWKYAVDNFNKNSSLEYHKQCLSDASNFSNVLKNPETSIINMIQTDRMKQVLENRQNIKPIIEAIM